MTNCGAPRGERLPRRIQQGEAEALAGRQDDGDLEGSERAAVGVDGAAVGEDRGQRTTGEGTSSTVNVKAAIAAYQVVAACCAAMWASQAVRRAPSTGGRVKSSRVSAVMVITRPEIARATIFAGVMWSEPAIAAS